jgi:membrane-bound serine protease (ClpP class)
MACLVALAAGASALAAAQAQAAPARVETLSLTGVVDPFMASYVERGISAATHDHDAAVLLTIDTPGGLDSSMRRIVHAILAAPVTVPVICYTGPSGARAASAGTFIMLACPINAMAPGTNIGAAHPVGVSGVIEQEKVTNDAAAFIRSLAERSHRNADWAERAVRDAISASAEQALQLHVVDFIADSTRSLLDMVGRCGSQPAAPAQSPPAPEVCAATSVPFRMSFIEGIFHSVADPNIAFLLLNIGFISLVVWVIHPGFHVSLIAGVTLTVLGLLILETLPVRLVGLALLFAAALLFVVDVKAKAHGVLTAGGIAVLITGGLFLFNPSIPTARVSRPLLVFVAVAIGAFSALVLRALVTTWTHPIHTGAEGLEGEIATAVTGLAPQGMVRARGESWSARSLAGQIPAGATVRIVRVKGLTLEVEPEPSPAASVPGP